MSGMDLLRQIRSAQEAWVAEGFGPVTMQGMSDARTLLAQAIADRNDTMIRIYSETCLLLLEANRRQAAEWMAIIAPDKDAH
jgi:hypothetical protein